MTEMNKMVDKVVVPMTPEEIAEFEAMGREGNKQTSLVTPDPGPGPSYKETLGVVGG